MSANKNLSDRISGALKQFVAEESAIEYYTDRTEMAILVNLIGHIANSGDALIVTFDPYDDYKIAVIGFREVVIALCGLIQEQGDIRIFGYDWAVGVSSYSSNQHEDPSQSIKMNELEIKISLVGAATSWITKPH